MRTIMLFAVLVLGLAACKKDKYTTAPQIKLKDVSPNYAISGLGTTRDNAPKLTLEVTDAEGDLGFISGVDTSKIFIKNLKSNNVDSFLLPDIQTSAVKNFKADIIVSLYDGLECIEPPVQWPVTDTLAFEVYIVDFAKNKSNVITTNDKPVYYRCE